LGLAGQPPVPAVSYAHKNEFARILQEYEAVASLLSAAVRRRKRKPGTKMLDDPVAAMDSAVAEAAITTANDAYALLLMARCEGYMREYLMSLGVPLDREPKLSTLIDRTRKEFNRSNPRIPIRPDIAAAVHDLREQRNAYAHGHGTNVFPPVDAMVVTLGRFFDQLP